MENLLETVSSKPNESSGIPINTPTYEDIFQSSEESSSSSSEDETGARDPRIEKLVRADQQNVVPEIELPDEDQKSIKEDNLKTSEDDEKNNFEKKLESLFKTNSLKAKVFEKSKIQKNNSESIIRQNEHLNKRRVARPKVRRPIRKRQNRNGTLLMVL